jgi:hypothetical protein
MALQTTAVAKQWLSSDFLGTPTYTNATTAQQQRNGAFCAVYAGELRGLLRYNRCEPLLLEAGS